MKFRIFNRRVFGALWLLLFFSETQILSAENEGTQAALVQSMEARLPELMELKLSGKVGETNMGLVEARVILERKQRRLLADENRDRLANYKIIANELGIPVAAVQWKRAEQIRKNSPKGVWIESKSGYWYRE
jgi:uncharacterized protein YdbL (DUF1318 family)